MTSKDDMWVMLKPGWLTQGEAAEASLQGRREAAMSLAQDSPETQLVSGDETTRAASLLLGKPSNTRCCMLNKGGPCLHLALSLALTL